MIDMGGKYIGFEIGNEGYERIIELEEGIENLAAFIASSDPLSHFIIKDSFDKEVLQINERMIVACPDKTFLQKELLPELVPMQCGVTPIPELKIIHEQEIGITATETEDELEMN